jgi:hypothetical protein
MENTMRKAFIVVAALAAVTTAAHAADTPAMVTTAITWDKPDTTLTNAGCMEYARRTCTKPMPTASKMVGVVRCLAIRMVTPSPFDVN